MDLLLALPRIVLISAMLCVPFVGHAAEDLTARWGGVANLGAGITSLKDDSPAHIMSHENVSLLLGYRIKNWLVGPLFDYRLEQQHSSLASSGGTNFAGSAWTFGLGGRYSLTSAMAIQVGVAFLGKYNFKRQTYASEDAHLSGPIGVVVRPQLFLDSDNSWSLDLDLRFLRWTTFMATSGNLGKQVDDFSVGLSLSYHFPGVQRSASQPPLRDEPLQAVVEGLEAEKTAEGMKINLSGALFSTGATELNDGAIRQKLLETGRMLAKSPNCRIRVEGHTDSVGAKKSNMALSQARADHIKAILVEGGVSKDLISAKGFGASKPTADNGSADGRSKNRRIEIFVDEIGN